MHVRITEAGTVCCNSIGCVLNVKAVNLVSTDDEFKDNYNRSLHVHLYEREANSQKGACSTPVATEDGEQDGPAISITIGHMDGDCLSACFLYGRWLSVCLLSDFSVSMS